MSIRVEAEDVICLIAQFLEESGLQKTLKCLQQESGCLYTPHSHSQNNIHNLILTRNWADAIQQLANLSVAAEQLYDLYELIVQDLRRAGEFAVASDFIRESGVFLHMRDNSPDRYISITSSSSHSSSSLRLELVTKEGKSLGKVADEIIAVVEAGGQVNEVRASRLLSLLNSGLKFEFDHGLIAPGAFDIYRSRPRLPFNSSSSMLNILEQAGILAQYSMGRQSAVECMDGGSADGGIVVCGRRDGYVEVYDCRTGKLKVSASCEWQRKKQFIKCSDSVLSVSICDDGAGDLVACGALNGSVSVFSLLTGRQCQQGHYRVHGEGVTALQWLSRTQIVSGGLDCAIKLFGLRTGHQMREFRGHSGAVTNLQVQVNLNRLFSASADETVKCWDVQTSNCLYTLRMGGPVYHLSLFHPSLTSTTTTTTTTTSGYAEIDLRKGGGGEKEEETFLIASVSHTKIVIYDQLRTGRLRSDLKVPLKSQTDLACILPVQGKGLHVAHVGGSMESFQFYNQSGGGEFKRVHSTTSSTTDSKFELLVRGSRDELIGGYYSPGNLLVFFSKEGKLVFLK